ncbi:ftsH [Symbiodinium natans]|uniref:FtsH protein n=1 Tax=Symbiodinium natans TaxID=878477 RepID=A0A812NGW5_9DINO|nr:ftsH [Symbiodinium natans]
MAETPRPLLLLSLLVAWGRASPCEGPVCLDDTLGFTALVQTDQHYRRQRSLQAAGGNQSARQGALPGTGSPPVPDVRAAFAALGRDGRVLEIDKGSAWPSDHYKSYMPPYAEHIEGVQRFKGSYIAFSGAESDAGDLFIAALNGVAGSGRLGQGTGEVVKRVIVDSTLTHAGGFQISGDLLAIGAEAQCSPMQRVFGGCKHRSQVLFFDLSDPLNPVKLPTFIDRPGKTAGAVGIVRQANGKWLVMVGDGDNNNIDLYVEGEAGSFNLVASWGKQELLKDAGVEGGYKSYQNMNVLLQSDGQLFMVCTALSSMFMGSDYFDLFTVQPSDDGRATITMVDSKKATCHGCTFAAAAGIYVNPEDPSQLLGYASGWLPSSKSFSSVPVPGNTIFVNEF